jgi:hypothetical protein
MIWKSVCTLNISNCKQLSDSSDMPWEILQSAYKVLVYKRINIHPPPKNSEVCENLTLMDCKTVEDSTNLLQMIFLKTSM